MKFAATIRCEHGHEQTVKYDGIPKEEIEHHLIIMCGGVLEPLGLPMPGMRCQWEQRGPLGPVVRFPRVCGGSLTYSLSGQLDLPEATVDE